MSREIIGKWSAGQRLAVLQAMYEDIGYSANINITCPVCHKETLDYQQINLFDAKAWCETCKCGIHQGK